MHTKLNGGALQGKGKDSIHIVGSVVIDIGIEIALYTALSALIEARGRKVAIGMKGRRVSMTVNGVRGRKKGNGSTGRAGMMLHR